MNFDNCNSERLPIWSLIMNFDDVLVTLQKRVLTGYLYRVRSLTLTVY